MLRHSRQKRFRPRLRLHHRPLQQHLHLQQRHLTSSSLLIGVQSKLSYLKDQISLFPLIGMRSRKYPGSRIRMTSNLAQILVLLDNRRQLTLVRQAQHRHSRQEECLAVLHLNPPLTHLRVEVLGHQERYQEHLEVLQRNSHLEQEHHQVLELQRVLEHQRVLENQIVLLLHHSEQMPGHHKPDPCLVKRRQEFRRSEDQTNRLKMHLKYPARAFLQSCLAARHLTPRHQGRCHGRICRLLHLSTSAKCLTTTTL